MARQRAKVVVDTSHLERDTARLVAGLKAGGPHEAAAQAQRTAARVRAATPVRTGRLRSTVGTVPTFVYGRGVGQGPGAWGVTYGGGLPYAGKIERSRHPVRKGARGSKTEFQRACNEVAERLVGRV